MTEPLIRLAGLKFGYPGRPDVLRGLDLTVWPDSRLGLVGPNGCGKTTALSIIMGLIKPREGRVEILGRECRREADFLDLRPQLGFVFQDADDQLFCPTVGEDLAFGPLNLGASRAQAAEIVQETLQTLGLEGFGPRVTYDLSGGEKKLVALGTALALKPKMLILDEPTTFLDRRSIGRLETAVKATGLPFLIVSHDQDFLDRMVEARLIIEEGQTRPL
ncbi:MAG: energy-coupling factor ABC transporter ATP-binding protein [Deltaproteobacteria bacterium]|nr:energy-coupling factor ABC transporter ATP-binding protein [Deltaproteobacteria bacterium]